MKENDLTLAELVETAKRIFRKKTGYEPTKLKFSEMIIPELSKALENTNILNEITFKDDNVEIIENAESPFIELSDGVASLRFCR